MLSDLDRGIGQVLDTGDYRLVVQIELGTIELLTFALDGTADTDRDGFTNAEEQANGTDPLRPERVVFDPGLRATAD